MASALAEWRRSKNANLLSLFKDIDSWGDSGGLSQCALIDGVAALDSFSNAIEESNIAMLDDIFWQSKLASSAVATVQEVCDAVRAAQTASSAKSAAFAAAEKAKKKYEACNHTSSKEKIQQTQREASIAKSHAIHATVVEYGAKIAKKRSAVSLVQDLKVWNTHRKSHLLKTSIQAAKSQLDVSRKAADALTSLINSSVFSHDECEINASSNLAIIAQEYSARKNLSSFDTNKFAFQHNPFITKSPETPSSVKNRTIKSSSYLIEGLSQCVVGALTPISLSNMEESINVSPSAENQLSHSQGSSQNDCFTAFNASYLDEDYFLSHQGVSDADNDKVGFTPSNQERFLSEDTPNKDVMSTSMQSLIDGLIAWGGDDEKANLNGTIRQSVEQ